VRSQRPMIDKYLRFILQAYVGKGKRTREF
jgi:hypothetical protein